MRRWIPYDSLNFGEKMLIETTLCLYFIHSSVEGQLFVQSEMVQMNAGPLSDLLKDYIRLLEDIAHLEHGLWSHNDRKRLRIECVIPVENQLTKRLWASSLSKTTPHCTESYILFI